MIYVIAAISLLFIAFGFLLNEGNAKYLLAGYNTMSKESRKKVDIKAFLPYFRKFHIFLGISLFVFSFLLKLLVNDNATGIFFATYPIIAYIYFIFTSSKFYGGQGSNYSKIGVSILLLTLVFVVILLSYGFKENAITFDQEKIEFHGSYGEIVLKEDLKRMELIDHLPKIIVRTNGFALGEIRKGYFKTDKGDRVKLIVNAEQSPLILFTKNDNKKIYYSAKSGSNQILFNEIKQVLEDINE